MCTQWSISYIKKMIVPFAGKQTELEIHLPKNYKPDSESERCHLYGIKISEYAYYVRQYYGKELLLRRKGPVEGEQERRKGVMESNGGQSMRHACVTMSSGNLKPHPLCPKLFGPNHGEKNGSLAS